MRIEIWISSATHICVGTQLKILFSYLELAAHFLEGFDEAVLVVEHDAVMVLLPGAHSKSHLHLLFLMITSQGNQQQSHQSKGQTFSLFSLLKVFVK